MRNIIRFIPLAAFLVHVCHAEPVADKYAILNAAANGDIQYLTSLTDPHQLHITDQHGFTLYDYVRMNQNNALKRWAERNHINSGINNQLIKKMQLWFLLLDVPTNNTKGIYNKQTQQDILKYQRTRGLKESFYISPRWFADLEIEGLLVLQNLLLSTDHTVKLTGKWDEPTITALKTFQQKNNLPITGFLSEIDIIQLKKIDTRSLADSIAVTALPINNKPKTNQKRPAQEQTPATVIAPLAEPDTTPDIADKNDDETSNSTDNLPIANEPSGFLISSNAKPGKILTLQAWLTLAGFPSGELDGYRGPLMRQAIMDYQKSINQNPTGIPHPDWETVLETTIRKKVQQKLKSLELYDQQIDGINGLATEIAIKKYEQSKHLKVTGKMLPETLSTLFNEEYLTDNKNHPDDQETAITVNEADAHEEESIIAEELLAEEDDDEEEGTDGKNTEIVSTMEFQPSKTSSQIFTPEGENKIILQQLTLTFLGFYQDAVDGTARNSLTEAIKEFQKKNKLSPDGKLGLQTNKAIEGQAILRLQQYFNEADLLKDKPTGTLGPKTRAIITKLKNDAKLPQTNHQIDIGILLIALDGENKTQHLKEYLSILEKERLERERIQYVQEAFIALGFLSGKAAGTLDDATKAAVQNFRKTYKLSPGTHINSALLPFIDQAILKKSQELINRMGYRLSIDGKMGPKTADAIRDIERKNKMEVTGTSSLKLLTYLNKRTKERTVASSRRAPAQINKTSTAPPRIASTAATQTETNRANIRITSRNYPGTTRPETRTSGPRPALPNLNTKVAQADRILHAEPSNTIKGRLSLIRNSAGTVSGCKVNNITIAADWCEGRSENQQCRVLYKNGRVLSVRCR